MRTLLIAIVLGSTMSCLAYAAGAATTAEAPSAATETPAAPMSQPDKMKKCNADAKGMHGSERREFMSKCLSKKRSN